MSQYYVYFKGNFVMMSQQDDVIVDNELLHYSCKQSEIRVGAQSQAPCLEWVWFVLTSNRKSRSRNTLVISVLTYDLSFKVICDSQGQTYTNHAISPLLLPVEIQYVLPSYRKSQSRNPLILLVLTYDLSFKVICVFQGEMYTNHAISP